MFGNSILTTPLRLALRLRDLAARLRNLPAWMVDLLLLGDAGRFDDLTPPEPEPPRHIATWYDRARRTLSVVLDGVGRGTLTDADRVDLGDRDEVARMLRGLAPDEAAGRRAEESHRRAFRGGYEGRKGS